MESLKNLGHIAPSANTSASLYQVGSGKAAIISKLVICNQNATTAKVRLRLAVADATLDATQWLEYDMQVLAGFPSPEILQGLTMGALDRLYAQSDLGAVSFNLTGSEVS
jgi:hypothetical protein